MEHLSSAMEQQQEQQVQWRRDKVWAKDVGLATVNRDVVYLRNQAKTNIKKYIDERLPEEYEKCLIGIRHSKHGKNESNLSCIPPHNGQICSEFYLIQYVS